MAQGAYTLRLFLGVVPANSIVKIGAPQDGYTWIVRDIEVNQAPAAGHAVQLRRSSDAANLIGVDVSTAPSYKQWQGRVAVPAAEGIELYAAGAAATVTVTGYRLGSLPG